jgi:hypothetical protein
MLLDDFQKTFSLLIKNFRRNLNDYYLGCWSGLITTVVTDLNNLEKLIVPYCEKAITDKQKLFNKYRNWRKENEKAFKKMDEDDKNQFIHMGLRLNRVANTSRQDFYVGMINITFLSLVKFCYVNYDFIPHDKKGLDFVLFVINESFEVAKADNPSDIDEFIKMTIEEFNKRIFLYTEITDEDVIELGTKTGEYKKKFLKIVNEDKNLVLYVGYPLE